MKGLQEAVEAIQHLTPCAGVELRYDPETQQLLHRAAGDGLWPGQGRSAVRCGTFLHPATEQEIAEHVRWVLRTYGIFKPDNGRGGSNSESAEND